MRDNGHEPEKRCRHVARQRFSTVSLTDTDLDAARKAMGRAAELEGMAYQSVAEFIRDALRRRVEAINEAWRDQHAVRDRLGLGEPRKKKD